MRRISRPGRWVRAVIMAYAAVPLAVIGAGPGEPGLAALPPGGKISSVAFYYQQFGPSTDLSALEGADIVVTRSQVDEAASAARLHGLGALAYRYVQFYWFPSGASIDGFDLAQHPDWVFCASGSTPTLGRVDSTGIPWYFLDLDERGAYDAAVALLTTLQTAGYDGVMIDRGFAATVAGAAADGTRIWNKQSTCTTDPVASGRRFADAYVGIATAAHDLGLQVMFNYGVSPFHARYRMRPDPADPRCDLTPASSDAAWAACPRLGDLAGVATSILDEGHSHDRDDGFATGWLYGAEAERNPAPLVVGLIKASGTPAEVRAQAYYRWARAKLFDLPLAVNSGDDRCVGFPPGPCWRNGFVPELTQVRLGVPVLAGPTSTGCDLWSGTRCVHQREYENGRVVVNVTGRTQPAPLGASPTDLRDLDTGLTVPLACTTSMTLAPWTGTVLERVPRDPAPVSGFTLDGFGTFHGFGDRCASTTVGPSWAGWDIARGAALSSGGSSGYLVDGFGGVHAWAADGAPLPTAARSGPYWRGWDIARAVAVLPDGSGGYVLDGWGGLHPFAIGSGPAPPPLPGVPYFPGLDVARSFSARPDGTGAYLSLGDGALVPAALPGGSVPPLVLAAPRWLGWSIARGTVLSG